MWVSAPFLTFFKSLKCRLFLSIHSFLGKMNQNKLGIPLSLYSGFASHFKMFGKEDFQLQLFLLDWTLRNRWSLIISSVQFSCSVVSDSLQPMNRSTPGLPVHHQLPEFTQTHLHQVSDAIQPSHPLSSPSPPASNPSHHQGLFQWVNSSHEVAKVLEFQL